MNAAERCPFPLCTLHVEHEGNHLPGWRLVQRFTQNGPGLFPGFCEQPKCRKAAVALYANHDGKSLLICETCEAKLPVVGAGKAAAA